MFLVIGNLSAHLFSELRQKSLLCAARTPPCGLPGSPGVEPGTGPEQNAPREQGAHFPLSALFSEFQEAQGRITPCSGAGLSPGPKGAHRAAAAAPECACSGLVWEAPTSESQGQRMARAVLSLLP